MLISRISADLLRLPLPRPRALPMAKDSGPPPPNSITVLLVQVGTDDGLTGLGFAYDFSSSGRQASLARAAVEELLAPQVIDADPRLHRQLHSRLHRDLPGAMCPALAAVDIAIWDLAAKAAALPLWQFLGGARDAVPVHAAETSWPSLGVEQILALYEKARANGITGLQVAVGGPSPEADARKLELIRNEIGLDDWLGVTAHGSYDAGTALAMGRFLEEEMDADWFEDPVPAEDRAGIRRLADKLEIPVAAGNRFDRVSDFTGWVGDTAAGILRPDALRLGGLTPTIQVIDVATAFHRPSVPVMLPEVAVHLACGLPGARAVDYVSWLEPLWETLPVVADGKITPPPGPGLGLDLKADALDRFRVER